MRRRARQISASAAGTRGRSPGIARADACDDASQSGQTLIGATPSLVAVLALPPVDAIDRPVPLDVAGKVEHQAVVLAVGAAACRGRPSARRGRPTWSGAAWRSGRRRRVEAGGQHVGVGETARISPRLKAAMMRSRSADARIAEDRLAARRRARESPRATWLGVRDTGAEHQPGAAVARRRRTISSTAASVIASRSTAACS